MAFEQRIEVAQAFEQDVESFCKNKFVSVAKNGTEHTHPEFVDKIRRNTDRGSKLVRFAPDGVALTVRGVVHWEAKASEYLEKDAYETYMAYFGMGARVMLFVRRRNPLAVYWQYVERVGFIPSVDVVAPYAPHKRHPIDAEDWICPRNGHGFAGAGSGTPYKQIDFESMKLIPDFYAAVAA